MEVFKSGATSSKIAPRFDLLSPKVFKCLADRAAEGLKRGHPKGSWKLGVNDPEFITDRINHMLFHVMKFQNGDFGEDSAWGHLGGILFNCMIIAESIQEEVQTIAKSKDVTI